jgi:hypothetical protein
MKRRALIVYCNDTSSGVLPGPEADNANLRQHLISNLGGDWYENEILSLSNPTTIQVINSVKNHLKGADYTLFAFSGHGYLNMDDNNRQYLELSDGDISIKQVITEVRRQAIIIDACRGFYSPSTSILTKGFEEAYDNLTGKVSTRKLFDHYLMNCEEGLTVLYAANENQTATDSDNGGVYLLSILKVCELWQSSGSSKNIFSLKDAHLFGIKYMNQNFDTIQKPTMNSEKRMRFYPFAVKISQLND